MGPTKVVRLLIVAQLPMKKKIKENNYTPHNSYIDPTETGPPAAFSLAAGDPFPLVLPLVTSMHCRPWAGGHRANGLSHSKNVFLFFFGWYGLKNETHLINGPNHATPHVQVESITFTPGTATITLILKDLVLTSPINQWAISS